MVPEKSDATPTEGLQFCLLGEGSLLIQCGEVVLAHGHAVSSIVTADASIMQWAEEKGIPHGNSGGDVVAFLREHPMDYLCSIVNLTMLPDEVLALPRRAAINFHDGPLPRYAGTYATSWALLHDESQHGVTWHEMTSEVDAGRIFKQRLFEISDDETAFGLNARCWQEARIAFEELVGDITGGSLSGTAQDITERSYFGLYDRPEAAGLLPWHRGARSVQQMVRALDFGPRTDNPLGTPRIVFGTHAAFVTQVDILDAASQREPGTIVEIDEGGITVATSTNDVRLVQAHTMAGESSLPDVLTKNWGLQTGDRFASGEGAPADTLTTLNKSLARHESAWIQILMQHTTPQLPYGSASDEGSSAYRETPFQIPEAITALLSENRGGGDVLTIMFGYFVSRLCDAEHLHLGFTYPELLRTVDDWTGLFATQVPVSFACDGASSVRDALMAGAEQMGQTRRRLTFARDVVARYPDLRRAAEQGFRYPVSVSHYDADAQIELQPGCLLSLQIEDQTGMVRMVYDAAALSEQDMSRIKALFHAFLTNAAADTGQRMAQVALMPSEERSKVMDAWNDTAVDIDMQSSIHHLFEAQVQCTPDQVAVVFREEQLTYSELDRHANRLAHHLMSLGVGPDVLVGICMERSPDLVISLMAVHKAGGAYVPVDPFYPRDRIALMFEDSGAKVLLTHNALQSRLPPHQAHVVRLDADADIIAACPEYAPDVTCTPDQLAYVIYTSGSTGRPKGVMVEHGNVVNFFVGMDAQIPHDPPGVWLAVTSLSFDISVLELFWTLTRGFKVVLHAEKEKARIQAHTPLEHEHKGIDFSLFYFSSDGSTEETDKYKLLLEGAKFADQNDFSAVWTPERHFHAFGGLYPNPAVMGAALAVATERVQIRAGSVVLPLHTPLRVAEEWSVVDNLSGGRVGISFASGWAPDDFVLKPENYADRKTGMFRDMDIVKRLWRGEAVPFVNAFEKEVPTQTLPRPIQKELPIWVTAAGNPETFRMAGEGGYNLLTHMLGQGIDELAANLKIYRDAWQSAGHEGSGIVSLMLHTFVSDNREKVRDIVREPMINYLRTATDLVKKYSWSFPTFKNNGVDPEAGFDSLSPEDMEALLEHAFDRYFETSGLFGTPDDCMEMVDRLKGIGVDDIACLIDFGVPTEQVLESLPHLNELRQQTGKPQTPVDDITMTEQHYTIGAELKRHAVSHMQCTPSMANMLVIDDESRTELAGLKTLLIGGEAFPPALARRLREATQARIINMYGPTETTIWSSTCEVAGSESAISIGRPIANTSLYIVDRRRQPVPVGVPGELLIGGKGVVRGYWKRPELTSERFVPDTLSGQGGRLYHTGDLVRYREDGNIEFLGRLDFQVKIRGHRIELGEIEARLDDHPHVGRAVVTAREDTPGDVRLVAYVEPTRGQTDTADLENLLRDYTREHLPEFMVPSHFVMQAAFPQTPNGKVDRNALPAPEKVRTEGAFEAPQDGMEQTLAEIWQDLLGMSHVGVKDNFFDLGGHSLLAVQAQHRIKTALSRDLSIIELFQYPTIRALVTHLEKDTGTADTLAQSHDRAQARRTSLGRRRQMRQRSRSS